MDRTELFEDGEVVAHIITVVMIRRIVHRANPDDVYTQLGKIVEPPDNSLQIADAVSVCILKASRIDLINNAIFPPVMISFHHITPCFYRLIIP